MNFVQAVSSGFRNYANFEGRAARSEYWYWTLFAILLGQAAKVIFVFVIPLPIIYLLVSLGTLLPWIAVQVRRLHDVDRSGWWALLGLTIIGGIYPLLFWAVQEGTKGPNRFGSDPMPGVKAPDAGTA